MSDKAYQNALEKRDRLKKEIEKVEEFLSLYQQFENEGTPRVLIAMPIRKNYNLPTALVGPPSPRSKKISPTNIKELTKSILKEFGRPLSRREIVNAIESKGYAVPGENKTGYLGSILFRNKEEISRAEDGGYWFTGWKAPNFPPNVGRG